MSGSVVVIGGTSLAGGRFSLTGTLVGALFIATLARTVNNIGIPSELNYLFKAVVVIAVARPRFTIRAKPSSSATSQFTAVRMPVMPPSGSRGLGASRVQSMTALGSGSPEATPSEKG